MFKFKELKPLEKQLLRLNIPITRTRAHVTWNESTCNPNSGTCNPNSGTCNIFTSKPLGQYRHSAITIHGSCAALTWQALVNSVAASQFGLETRFGAPPDYVSKHLPFGILDDPAGGAHKSGQSAPSFGQENVV